MINLSLLLTGKLTFEFTEGRDFIRNDKRTNMPGIPLSIVPRGTKVVTLYRKETEGARKLDLVKNGSSWITYRYNAGVETDDVAFCKEKFSKVYGRAPKVIYFTFS